MQVYDFTTLCTKLDLNEVETMINEVIELIFQNQTSISAFQNERMKVSSPREHMIRIIVLIKKTLKKPSSLSFLTLISYLEVWSLYKLKVFPWEVILVPP